MRNASCCGGWSKVPIAPEYKHLYGHAWRTKIRPKILARAGYRCERCHIIPIGGLEVAHLDQDPTNREDENLAALCRTCHARHDYASWARKCLETRRARKDAGRPLLGDL